MRKLRRQLDIIWEGATPLDGSPWTENRRYVPLSLNGGTGWGVFDKAADRFLANREVLKIDPRETLPAQ